MLHCHRWMAGRTRQAAAAAARVCGTGLAGLRRQCAAVRGKALNTSRWPPPSLLLIAPHKWSPHSSACRSSAVSLRGCASASPGAGLAASLVPPPNASSGFSSSQRRRAVLGVRLAVLALPAAAAGGPIRRAGTRLADGVPAVDALGVGAARRGAATVVAVLCGGRVAGAAAALVLGLEGVGMRELPCAMRVRAGCLAAEALAGRSTGLAAALAPAPAAVAGRAPAAALVPAEAGRGGPPAAAIGREASL